MTITVDLQAAAAAEAARIRAIRARSSSDAAWQAGGVPAAAPGRMATFGLHRRVAVFFIRTRVVDGSGRLVEDHVIPIEVRCQTASNPRRRREIRRQTQELFERCLGLVRAVCLAEVAERVGDLGSEYGRALEGARKRESHLAKLADISRHALVQPGLFDRRAMKDRMPLGQHDRGEALEHAASLLVAQQSETVLLLIAGSSA